MITQLQNILIPRELSHLVGIRTYAFLRPAVDFLFNVSNSAVQEAGGNDVSVPLLRERNVLSSIVFIRGHQLGFGSLLVECRIVVGQGPLLIFSLSINWISGIWNGKPV